MRWLFLLLQFLLVPAVAASQVQLPVNSQAVGTDGTTYLLTGTLTLTITPPGPPVPPVPPLDPVKVTSLKIDPDNLFLGQGTTGTVTLNRAPLQPIQVTILAEKGLTVPPAITINTGQTSGTFAIATSTAPNVNYWYTAWASYNGQSVAASVFVKPAVPIPPPVVLPTITGYTLANGQPVPAVGVVVGTTLTMAGTHFGNQVDGTNLGHVKWNGLECPKVSWTDTTIVFTVPPASSGSAPVQVIRTDGQTASGPLLTVMGLPPPANPPRVRGVQRSDGVPLLLPAPVGTVINVTGDNFGPAGNLWINGYPVTPKTWADTMITYTVNESSAIADPQVVGIQRPDGGASQVLFGRSGGPTLKRSVYGGLPGRQTTPLRAP